MKAVEMKKIAGWITTVLNNVDDEKVKSKVHAEVKELCKQFPLPY
jgi:glycine hydroxymethyltransferase